MFKEFKEKNSENKPVEKIESNVNPSKNDGAKHKSKLKGLDPATVTLKELFPEFLECGYDMSLMSAKEWEIRVTYLKTRKYLVQAYPQVKATEVEKTGMLENLRPEEVEEPLDIDVSKAAKDPQSLIFIIALGQVKAIYDKVAVLQREASDYEKYCLRFYWHLTYNWVHAKDVKSFREFWSYNDIFEVVDAYFKVCKKYGVPTFEEPYYFLDGEQRQMIKLEADMLKRTTNYGETQIRVSLLEAFL